MIGQRSADRGAGGGENNRHRDNKHAIGTRNRVVGFLRHGTVTLSARWYRLVNVAWSISPLRFFRLFGVPCAVAISIRLFDPRVPSKIPNGSPHRGWALMPLT